MPQDYCFSNEASTRKGMIWDLDRRKPKCPINMTYFFLSFLKKLSPDNRDNTREWIKVQIGRKIRDFLIKSWQPSLDNQDIGWRPVCPVSPKGLVLRELQRAHESDGSGRVSYPLGLTCLLTRQMYSPWDTLVVRKPREGCSQRTFGYQMPAIFWWIMDRWIPADDHSSLS